MSARTSAASEPRERSRAAERDASGGGAPRALRKAGFALTTFAAVIMGSTTSLLACPLCFGAQETSMIDGAKLGVLVMLGVLLVVQGAFAYFFLYLRKRAKENADIELDLEWSELQRGSRSS
jgi:hypothetical protein